MEKVKRFEYFPDAMYVLKIKTLQKNTSNRRLALKQGKHKLDLSDKKNILGNHCILTSEGFREVI